MLCNKKNVKNNKHCIKPPNVFVCVSVTMKNKKTHKNRTTEHNNSNTREQAHAFGSSEINDALPYMFVVCEQQQKQWQK